jgi:mono/diheme cytochrome c family protein
MRVSAEFENYEEAMVAHKALVEEAEIEGENIEFRSPYPVFEEPLAPHRHRPMRMRNMVRFLWVCGAIGGFSMVAYCQKIYPIKTGGHPIVPLPIDAVITYECAQITALVSTMVLFFIETKTFRQRPIPHEEDLAWANGNCVLVVDGPKAESAKDLLEKRAKTVRIFSTVLAFLGMLLLACTQTGCVQVRMRTQPAIKDSKAPNAPYMAGIVSMPWYKDPDVPGMEEPYGRILEPPVLAQVKKQFPVYPGSKSNAPASVHNFPNPIPNDAANLKRGELLFQENCQFCHGVKGRGDGPVGQIYAPQPADIAGRADLVKEKTDGDLFWTLTVAPSTMPPFGNKMSAFDRWTIVRYVRYLQREANGMKGPAPSNEPAPVSSPAGGQSAAPSLNPSTAPTPAASNAAPSEGTSGGTSSSSSPSGAASPSGESGATGASGASSASGTAGASGSPAASGASGSPAASGSTAP